MAQSVQNVTLSLTLPITCHICLGKVRQPVICTNNHVFCSVCIEVWLKNNSQCPACRIPITPENPCKEVLGGTSESNPVFSPAIRKHLRKTRLEILHKEYEDEIESLQKEMEEVKEKNSSLESQLKSVLQPLTVEVSDKTPESPELSSEEHRVDPETLATWTQKLQAANDMYEKVKDDMDKLIEVNKKLRLENGSLVRENLRLKAEVGSRSPQKYGRFTVAALQSKLEQCERETNRLKKALERSDSYIEDLELQISQLKRERDQRKNAQSESDVPVPMEEKESKCAPSEIVLLENPEEQHTEQNCLCASLAPDDLEPSTASGLLSTNNDVCLNSTSQGCSDESVAQGSDERNVFAGSREGLLDIAGSDMDTCSEQTWDKIEDCVPYKEELYELPDPCTPLSLSCLQLNTPSNKDSPTVKEESQREPSNFLRKLEFEDFDEASDDCNKDSPEHSASSSESSDNKATCFATDKQVFWNSCQSRYDENLDFEGSEPNVVSSDSGESSSKSSEKIRTPGVPKKLHSVRSAEINRTRTSSEASMDAAYLDKISELDSMMSESDNSKSPYYPSKPSSDLDNGCKSTPSPDLLSEKEKNMKERKEPNSLKCPLPADHSEEGNEWKSANFSILSPTALDITEPFPLFASRTSEVNEIKPQSFLFQRELSPSFLFNNSRGGSFEEHKLGSPLFKVAPELQNLQSQLQSPWSSSFVPDKKTKNMHTSAKRKIHSSLSSASPSKTTKN
ncbi:ORC ubiquitin ligase 1 [Anolis carolinensis]|uniref:ORC ubiquitin ligase 1 n=1 Tax=Anolis carolinensis TaxID=28377 RepID=G1KS86_ANOCA|nr:PREDICTED: RING finger protein 219 [Anolis carolinensis]|eukprot:XP_003218740.1 PREDICTED: RING finger protein 219 [Anolis carolinensis]